MASIETKDLLVEIGTEELPPKDLSGLAKAFGRYVRAKLGGAFGLVTGQQEQIYWSPRRLAVFIPHVRVRQPDREMETFGPPVSIAFGADGQPTPAAEGFARKCGTTVTKLKQKNGKLYFKSKVKGRPAEELVLEAVNEAVMKLTMPRRMRWGANEAEFIRPVHWIVMMLGDKTIKGTILGIRTGNRTYGHRFLHPGAIVLKRPADYCKVLRQTGKVWVEDEKETLKNRIGKFVKEAARRVRGKAQPDKALLEEVASLVEWPVAITGSFDKRFLTLPDEVVVSVLEGQQRYFPLHDAKGRLLPHFVAICNIQSRRPAEVKHGNERVIVPRLADALFFWNEDCKRTLESRIPDLDRVVFQRNLGHYGEKRQRIAELSQTVARQIGADLFTTRRAAELSKCDLLTNLVGEFPELQGIVGMHLALVQNEPKEVAQAIGEQYLPRFAGDRLPKSKAGQALAIADKLDTVCGIFNAGEKPTGEKDPFALRRQMLGAIRIAIECKLDLGFKSLIASALNPFQNQPQNVELEIFGFLTERLRAYCEERDIDPNIFYAAEATESGNPFDFWLRLVAVQEFMKRTEAKTLVAANKRIANILKKENIDIQTVGAIKPVLLKEPAEVALDKAVKKLEAEIKPLIEKHEYTTALLSLATLRPIIDEFFDRIMVMVEDQIIRKNRIALVANVRHLFLEICDLSRVQVSQ